MATKTLSTVDDFVQSLGRFDTFQELVEGEIITMSPGMYPHNYVRDLLLRLLAAFVEEKRLGIVLSEQPFHLFGATVRYPDVAFVRDRTRLVKIPEGAPDLATEVVSPTNSAREMSRRISDFFAAGSSRVWVVYPEEREVYIHGMSGVVCRKGDEKLEDPELLPGFSVKVSTLFEQI